MKRADRTGLRRAIRVSPLAVLLLRDGVIVEASPLLLDLLGVARKNLTGSPVESVVTGGWDPETIVPVVVGVH